MITTFGLLPNEYAGDVQSEVVLVQEGGVVLLQTTIRFIQLINTASYNKITISATNVELIYNKSTQKSLNQVQNSAKPIVSLAKKPYLCSHIAAIYLM